MMDEADLTDGSNATGSDLHGPHPDGATSVPTWPEEGTAEASCLLVFLDHDLTDLEVLEESVGLDLRSASSLLKHRDGSDGQRHTDDDDPFDSVWEVDDIPGVAEPGLVSMVDYALDHGFPEGPFAVSYDDVWMTEGEAWDVLVFVNTTSLDVLDHEVGFDARTVDALEGMRPLRSPGTFAALPYVGPVTWHRVLDALHSDLK
jgi:hypothetical protein